MTELQISKKELNKLQKNLYDIKEKLKHKERQLNMSTKYETQHHKNYELACDEIKELKEICLLFKQ